MALSWDSFDSVPPPIVPTTPKVLGPEDFYPLIDEISTTHGVDPRLVRSMVKTESNFNPQATSPAGAKGLLQLMDPTAKELGVVDSFNPRQNLDGGVRYIKKLMYMYGGDQEKALAAYNFGMGNVAQGLEYPQETRDYITKVMAGMAPVEGQVPKPQPSLTWDSFDGETPSQGGAGDILEMAKTGAKMIGDSLVESTTPVVPTGKLPLGIPSSQNKLVQGMLDVAYGIPEAGAALASGAASFPLGQAGGLAAIPRDEKSLAKAFDIAEKVNETGMYKPVTNTGQLLLKPIETAFGTFLGTVDKVARATAPEGASEEDLETRSKAWQYIANTALLGAPMAVAGSRRAARAVRKGKVEVTPEVLESAKAKVLADPKVPDSVKAQAAATPLDKIAEQINKGQATARVDKTSGPQVKFEGNADVVKGLLIEAEMREGRAKTAMRKAAKIVAEHEGDIAAADLKSIKGINPTGSTGKAIGRIIEERKLSEGTGEVPEFSPPDPTVPSVVEPPIVPTGTRAEVPVRKSSTPPTEAAPIQEVLNSLEPGITYQGSSKLGEFETHQFITSEGRNFSSLSLEPEEVRARYEKVKEGFEPMVEETSAPVTEVTPEIITPEFDSVGIAKEEGYEFPGKKRYSSFEDAQVDATSRGSNFEVVKIGGKYRVGKYTEETPRGEYVPEVVETGEARRVFELAKEEEKRKATEGTSEVDDLYSDGVTAEDWKVLEKITRGVNLEEIRLGEEVVAEVKAAKEASQPSETFYHGSRSESIEGEFRPTEYGDYGKGVYITSNKKFANSFTDLQNFGVSGKDIKEGPKGSLFKVTHDLKSEELFGGDRKLSQEELDHWAKDGSDISDYITHEDLIDGESASNNPGGSWIQSQAWDRFLDKFGYKGVNDGRQIVIRDPSRVKVAGRVVDSSTAAQKFLEWRDSYVTKRNVAIPASGGGKTPITKEALPIVDDKFAIFDKLEDAEAFRDAKGSEREIIRDPATGKYFLEPELDLLDKGDMWDMGEKEYLEESYGREGGLGDEVLDYDERGDGAGRDLWSIMNNERGSVDVTGLRVAVDQIENVVKMAKKVGKTVDDYLSSMGVDQASIELFKASLANVGQMKQEIRDGDKLGAKILDPEGPIVHQTIKKDRNGKVVWTKPAVPKDLADGVVGMSRESNFGKDIARTDPKTGRVTVEHTTNVVDRFMTATETKINAFRGPIRDLYRTWRDSLAKSKAEKAEVKVWLDGLKSQIATERLKDFAIACYADMKSVKEAYEKMGITDIPSLLPHEELVKEQLLDYTRKFRERSNYIRTHTGQKAIPKLLDMKGRENYLPLFRDLNVLRELGLGEGMVNSTSAKLGQLSKTFNGMFNPHAKKRNVSDIPIELDPFKAIEKYSSYGLDEIHISPVAALAKELAYVKLPHPSGTGKVTLREWNPALSVMLSKWSDAIVGKDPTATAMANTNPLIHKGLESLSKNLVLATIGGSLRTIFVQPSSYVIAVPTLLDTKSTMYGLSRMVADRTFSRKASLAKQKSSVLAIREFDLAYSEWTDYVQRGLATGTKDWLGNKSMAPMKWVDGVVAEASWNAGYHYGKNTLKLGGDDLVHFADDVVEKTQGMGIKGAVSDIQTGKVTKWLTLLQTFGIADFNFIIRDVLGIKNADVNNKQALMRATKYIVATVLAGQLYKMMGYENVVPDPVGEYLKVKGDDGSDVHAIASAAGELLEKLPMIGGSAKYGSSLGGVMGEWASLVPEAAMKFSESLDWDKLTPREKRKNIQMIAKAIGYSYGVPMTNQIMKSINTAYNGGNPYEVIMGVYKEAPRGNGRRKGLPSSF